MKNYFEMNNFVVQDHFRVLFVYVDDHLFYYQMENYVLKMKKPMIQEHQLEFLLLLLLGQVNLYL